ncbi:MAG: arginine deiminase-related protein [Bacteroidota bacterium]
MYSQITDSIFMVRPVQFFRNDQTAVNNYFQKEMDDITRSEIQIRALDEFDLFVSKLRLNNVHVEIFEDLHSSETPDSIFPNNWLTMHDDGVILTYPMFAENRRLERRDDIIDQLKEEFFVHQIQSFSNWEANNKFLEGTGSLILDRPNRIVYAAISGRTSPEVLDDFCERLGYSAVKFSALQSVEGERLPIYHTNVMLSIGENFAVVCLECIDDPVERAKVDLNLKVTGKEIIEITEKQVINFAGNVLQVRNAKGKPIIVMSESAFKSFSSKQLKALEKHGQILYTPIPTIEKYGGGGVRCMMAEIFLPTPTLKKQK